MTGAETRLANYGGPMSRKRTERIFSTLLGSDEGTVRCPRIIRIGLKFRRHSDPVATIEAILRKEGYMSAEALRADYAVPEGRLICRPLAEGHRSLSVHGGDRGLVLEQALMLGLCTAQLYDPSRPVLWTQTSLTRCLELFDPTGFYA